MCDPAGGADTNPISSGLPATHAELQIWLEKPPHLHVLRKSSKVSRAEAFPGAWAHLQCAAAHPGQAWMPVTVWEHKMAVKMLILKKSFLRTQRHSFMLRVSTPSSSLAVFDYCVVI